MKKWSSAFLSFFKRQSRWMMVILPSIIIGVFLFLMMLNNVYSRTYEIERFNHSKDTIRSPITIENEPETERKTRESVQSVEDKYTTEKDITEEQVHYIDEIFDAIDSFTKDNKKEKSKKEENSSENNTDEKLNSEEIVSQLNDILSKEITDNINDVVFMQLVRLDAKERTKGKKTFVNALEKIFDEGVRTENMHSAKEEVEASIKFATLEEETKEALQQLVDFAVVENAIYDVEKTMQARNEAARDVNPVVISSGDIIVREGQIITDEIYDDLKRVGLVQQDKNLLPAIGLFIFLLFICSIIMYELNRLYNRGQLSQGIAWTITIISFLTITLMKVASIFTDQLNQLFLVVPIATGVLLLKLLTFERFSIIMAIVYAITGSILFNGQIPGSLNMEACIYFLFFQLTGIFLLKNGKDRIQIMKTAFGMAVSNVMIITMFILLSFEKFESVEFLTHISFGVSAAVLSTVLTIGIIPFFETGFGLLSDQKLLTLANPNQPLLRKILIEAPGTYHHSVMVANLSEAACEAVGANGLLARVGAYYHDIGKTFQPHYFIENQMAIRNPHDFISPKDSAAIIISHVTEGVKYLKEYKLPVEIIDIAEQHHGTTLVGYFYHMEKQKNPDVDETLFRYPGPKPLTKEAGIISICDSVEAAVRSLSEPSPEKIDDIVNSIVDSKMMDGQFSETPLTLKELQEVKETVCEALKGIFHSRIQYPDKEAT